jgi:hypothetical protein
MIYTKNYSKMMKERKKIKPKLIWNFSYKKWFDKRYSFKGKSVLDFGSNIQSYVFKKTIKDKGIYYGFDIDENSIKWLKKNNYYIDFWKTKKRFDIIIATQVYEHLELEEREKFIEQTSKLVKENGLLLIDYPHTQNLNGLRYYKAGHKQPPYVLEEAIMMDKYGFKTKIFLIEIPKLNWFRTLFDILFGFKPHLTVFIEGIKNKHF